MTALLSGLTAAVALTACGVPPTGVIEAGEPASGMFSPSPQPSKTVEVTLFFLRDGVLTAYPRRIGDAGDLKGVVRLLFEGPTVSEVATATTELPRLRQAPRVAIVDNGVLSVRLPGETTPLSRRAMLQLACTVNQAVSSAATAVPSVLAEADGDAASRSTGPSGLQVLGDGWTMTQPEYECPVGLEPQQQPEH